MTSRDVTLRLAVADAERLAGLVRLQAEISTLADMDARILTLEMRQ